MGEPQNGWLEWTIPSFEMDDDWGDPHELETSIFWTTIRRSTLSKTWRIQRHGLRVFC